MNKLFDFLASVKLTVVLLILIAALAIIGTVIPQREPPGHYVQIYGESTAELFQRAGFTNMYASGWFVFLLALLGLNLVVCSLRRIPKTWKQVRFRPELKLRDYAHMNFRQERNFKQIPPGWKDTLQAAVSKRFSRIERQEFGEALVVFGEKTPWSRMGVYIVHASVLLLFIGAIMGGLWGFRGSVTIVEGETVDTIVLRGGGEPYPLDFQVRCDRFTVEFYETGAPKEFRSDVTFLKNGDEVARHAIRVNHPVTFEGITFYQSSYGTTLGGTAAFELVNNRTGEVHGLQGNAREPFQLPDGRGTFRVIHFQPNLTSGGMSFGPGVLIHLMGMETPSPPFWALQRFPEFDRERGGIYTFKLTSFDQIYYTGLQANRDPGVWVVYAGFTFMLAGFLVTFFLSHQMLWVQMSPSGGEWKLIVAGTAHRNRGSFNHRMEAFWSELVSTLE